MSLVKLPFLASITWGVHITMTPPHSSTPLDECLPPTGFETIAKKPPPAIKVCGHRGVQLLFWVASLSEIAVIIASNTSTHWLSQWILKLLIRSPNTSNSRVRMTFPFLIGWSLNLGGSFIRYYCYRILDKQFTFELSIRKNHKLITTGPYSIVRHPSYTGAILSGVGAVLCHMTYGSWVMEYSGLRLNPWIVMSSLSLGAYLTTTALKSRMIKEDKMLREQFGEQWDRWAARVPFKLIPRVY